MNDVTIPATTMRVVFYIIDFAVFAVAYLLIRHYVSNGAGYTFVAGCMLGNVSLGLRLYLRVDEKKEDKEK